MVNSPHPKKGQFRKNSLIAFFVMLFPLTAAVVSASFNEIQDPVSQIFIGDGKTDALFVITTKRTRGSVIIYTPYCYYRG
jgi:hypothetical protein